MHMVGRVGGIHRHRPAISAERRRVAVSPVVGNALNPFKIARKWSRRFKFVVIALFPESYIHQIFAPNAEVKKEASNGGEAFLQRRKQIGYNDRAITSF